MARRKAPKVSYDEKNKRWYMQGYKNNKRKVFYSKGPTLPKAQRELEAAYWDWYESIVNPSSISFIDAWDAYIKDYSARHKASSTYTLKSRGKAYLTKRFNRRPLGSIGRMEWQEVIVDAHSRGLAKKTLEGIATTIKAFCVFCAGVGYLADAAVPTYLFIPAGAPKAKKRALLPQEVRLLLSTEVDEYSWYIPHFRFLSLTGIRRGELCALRTERDFHRPYITIRETVTNELFLGSPKSGKVRTEILTSQALAAVDDHFKRREAHLDFMDEHLFCSVTGKRVNPKILSEEWRIFRADFGMEDVTLHELRHTFATYSSKNLEVEDLRKMLGHSKYMDTLGTYVHELPLTAKEREEKRIKDAARAKKIEEIFSMIESLEDEEGTLN